ncbi:MAG: hypothetical protein J6U61_09435 [Lachnospiraceae bacterium]|nr:hypothetical protein [Lachnospiraceae bacterium]
MSKDKLADAIGEIKDEYIKDSEDFSVGTGSRTAKAPFRRRVIYGIVAAAACLCLTVLGIYLIPRIGKGTNAGTQTWSHSMAAADYFKNAGKGNTSVSSSADLVMGPSALTVLMNDRRAEFEAEGIIPTIANHPEQSFSASYNGDGSLYKVVFTWMRRGESLAEYSDLSLIAAPKELHEISDVIFIRVDDAGNELPPYVTETVRDGIRIFAEGAENENKTLTWQTDKGWYQICGSFKDSYESMVSLLDWFWEHPLDRALFSDPPADKFIYSTRVEYPDAFASCIPDLAALGYTAESEKVNLGMLSDTSSPAYQFEATGNPYPIWFEGIYTRGDTRIRWTVNTGADADAWAESIGRVSEITEEKLTEALSQKDHVNIFFNMPCMVTLTIESGTAEDAWEVIQSMK